tara:strand:- start:6718 stop:8451 length:1734 start_codon:yes stop_codon:yes gene_type:complete
MADLPLLQSGRVEPAGIPGAVLPSVTAPQVDYVGLRAGAAKAQTVSQTLDRLSNQLFGIAKNAANEAGLQYAADNPLTDEQIQAAKAGNPEPLKLGGTFNVYDQAVRKARSFELSSTFEMEARSQMTTMLTAVEMGKATTEQVQNKLTTMMDGFSRSLSQVDPEASLKFRATSATMGNTVLAKAAEFEMKREKSNRLAKFDADFDNSTRLLEAAVSQGFWVDPRTQQKRSVDDLADVYRSSITTSALLLGDLQVQKQYSDKFEAALKSAKINAVTKFLLTDETAMADPEATLKNIQVGNVGKMSDVVKSMLVSDYGGIEKVSANYMVAVNARNTVLTNKIAADKRAAVMEFVPLYEKAIAAPEGSATRKQFANQIAELARKSPDAVPLGVIKDLLEPSKEGNPLAEFNILNGIFNGTITNPDQIMGNNSLNGKQKVTALKFFMGEDRRDQHELNTGLARLAGIPTTPGAVTIIDPKGQEFQRLQQLKSKAQSIQAQATAEGKFLQPKAILDQVSKDLETNRNTEQAKAARNTLTTFWEKKAGGPITRETLPALENSKKLKPTEITQIKRLLEQAEGN